MNTSGTPTAECVAAQDIPLCTEYAYAGKVSMRRQSMQADQLLPTVMQGSAVQMPALHVLWPIQIAEELGWASFEGGMHSRK